jgi:hypothetical protein
MRRGGLAVLRIWVSEKNEEERSCFFNTVLFFFDRCRRGGALGILEADLVFRSLGITISHWGNGNGRG